MEGPDKRQQLDDEMSRFEAEILGPSGHQGGQPARGPSRLVIGANTYNQVQQQLQQHEPFGPRVRPMGPSLHQPRLQDPSAFGPNSSFLPHGSPTVQRPPGPHIPPNRPPQNQGPPSCPPSRPRLGLDPGMHPGLRPIGPVPSMGQGPRMATGPDSFGAGRPGPLRPPFVSPGNGPQARSLPPPPPPPIFMKSQQNGSFPPPPPSFIPSQVSRQAPPQNMAVGNVGIASSIGPSFLRPPPPPPGLIPSTTPNGVVASAPPTRNPTLIAKAPVISSAPKLYMASATSEAIPAATEEISKITPILPVSGGSGKNSGGGGETKKKKQKTDNAPQGKEPKKTDMSHAQEMAEQVKQSTVTTKVGAAGGGWGWRPGHPHHHEERKRRPKKNLRYAGGQVWEDPMLSEWDPDDFRMFAGDLGNDVTDELLQRYFSHFASFVKAKVCRDKRTNKSKGYGFISFRDPQDYIRAMKEMNGRYVGSRPIKLRKSTWRDRNLDVVQKKAKEKKLLGLK